MTDLKEMQQQIIDMFDAEIIFDPAQGKLLAELKLEGAPLREIVKHKVFKRKSSAISFNALNTSVLLEQYYIEGKNANIYIIILTDFLDNDPLVKVLNRSVMTERFYFELTSKLKFFRN